MAIDPERAKHIEVLKEKLVQAKNLGEPWDYFFDHLGEDQSFLDFGTPTEHEVLESVLAEIGAQVLKHKVAMTDLRLMGIPDHDFLHGRCFLDEYLTTILYFSDIDVGVLCLARSPTSGQVLNARFSLTMIDQPGDGPLNMARRTGDVN